MKPILSILILPSQIHIKKTFFDIGGEGIQDTLHFLPSRSCLIQATDIVKDFKQLTALWVDG